ncbi:MAG: hypothetical protein LBU67_03715 [Oscillospiraceae bacterium]|nr:hypothetical protein [Oscillospiraceae bacterium]
MKIPERLKVGGVTYEVKVAPKIIDPQDLIGRINHGSLIIEVRSTLADDAAKKCFLHEMFHAIDEHTGVGDVLQASLAYSGVLSAAVALGGDEAALCIIPEFYCVSS